MLTLLEKNKRICAAVFFVAAVLAVILIAVPNLIGNVFLRAGLIGLGLFLLFSAIALFSGGLASAVKIITGFAVVFVSLTVSTVCVAFLDLPPVFGEKAALLPGIILGVVFTMAVPLPRMAEEAVLERLSDGALPTVSSSAERKFTYREYNAALRILNGSLFRSGKEGIHKLRRKMLFAAAAAVTGNLIFVSAMTLNEDYSEFLVIIRIALETFGILLFVVPFIYIYKNLMGIPEALTFYVKNGIEYAYEPVLDGCPVKGYEIALRVALQLDSYPDRKKREILLAPYTYFAQRRRIIYCGYAYNEDNNALTAYYYCKKDGQRLALERLLTKKSPFTFRFDVMYDPALSIYRGELCPDEDTQIGIWCDDLLEKAKDKQDTDGRVIVFEAAFPEHANASRFCGDVAGIGFHDAVCEDPVAIDGERLTDDYTVNAKQKLPLEHEALLSAAFSFRDGLKPLSGEFIDIYIDGET